EVLLAVGDVEVAVGVDAADVAGVEPAVLHGLGGGAGVLEVAAEDPGASQEHLAVVGDALLEGGDGAADGAEADGAGAVDVGDDGGLGHAVGLVDGEAGGPEELQDLEGDGGGA